MKIENMTVAQLKGCFALIVDLMSKGIGNYYDLGIYIADIGRKLLEELNKRDTQELIDKYVEEDTKTC